MLGDMLECWRLGVTASRLGFRVQTEVIKGKTFHVTLKRESEVAFHIGHSVAMDGSVKTGGTSLTLL